MVCRVSARIVIVSSMLTLPAVCVAQEEPKRVTEDLVSREGRRVLRDAYFEQRRQGVDPRLDAARARLDAVLERQAAERQRSGPALPPWQAFGPAPINFGQTPTSVPRIPSDVSGRVTAIAFDEINEVVYIGGAQGGLWSSDDNGATWTPLTDQLASTAIGAIAIDPPASVGNPATIYIGTGEANGSCDSYAGVGIYKSTDSGASWTGPIGSAQLANRTVASIVIDRTDPTHLLLSTSSGIFGQSCTSPATLPDRGVFESTDSGATWTKRTTGNHRSSIILQDPQTATTWWATGHTSSASVDPTNEGGLRKSIDNGMTWTQVAGTGGLPALATTWSRSWITGTTDSDFPGHSVLYVANGQTSGMPSGRIFRSTDSGANWTELTAARGFCDGQCFYDMPIYVEPGEESILYTGGAGTSTAGVVPSSFMRSDDSGATFVDKVRSGDASTALHADMHAITSWPGQPNRVWVGNDGGVWRSDDRGNNWIDVNNNLQLTQFAGCDLHPSDPGVMYGGSQDNGTEGRPGTDNWSHLDFGDGGFARIDQSDPDNLVHTYFNQTNNLIGVGFTTNGFLTTMGFYLGSFAPANGIAITDRVQFYAPIHLDRGSHDTLYFGTHRLWKAPSFFVSGGTGGEFSALDPAQDLAPGGGSLTAIETLANPTPGLDADLLYTGSNNGIVFRSTNGGTSWTQVDVGGSSLYVSDILVDPSNSNVVWQSRAGFAASAGLNVRKSINGGATWAPAATGIPNIPVNALAFDPSTAGRVWAGTDAGAFYTDDGGASWTPHNSGLPTSAIFALDSVAATRTLVACTHGRGAFVIQQGLIFADGFESGDTSAWSSTVP